ncbi:GLUT4 regulating protein TUG-domain-containing protein [Echria macrotheca]|uniref:GLUT4 regulating protein TUG-domain-containing protein n=1 Tax=Echria macrotheca TaxID=438768 RepID=A0AAJ0BAZ7_9PEZI|nr:GLUT4 regulating protein TUG-domain-containing protein [Echria macrotheca]
MAAHVEVIATDLRRVKVKVMPTTYLVDVLDEACQKLSLNSDRYLLKHKQKNVDLTGPFRTSGLSPGAKLELVIKSSSPSVISIALDIAGRRVVKKLPSDMTLWQVLRQFETAEAGLNITGRGSPKSVDGGQLYYERPVVNIMGRDYFELPDLQKTLSQCGINSGSMVLRVSFRNTEQTLYEAMEQISTYLKDVEPATAAEENKETAAPSAVEPTPESKVSEPSEQAPNPPEQTAESSEKAAEPAPLVDAPPMPSPQPTTAGDAMDIDQPSASSTPADRLQPTSVFSAPSSSTPVATQIQEDDSVYEPTIAHAQLRQQHLLARTQNTRLKSDAELAADAAEAAAKLAKITKVEVKVRFPDQTSAQWVVTPAETGAFLYQAVRGVMAHPSQPFRLVMAATHAVVHDDDKRLIADYRLKGRELLNCVWDDAAPAEARQTPFLKTSIASKAQAVVVPQVPQAGPDDDKNTSAGPSRPAGSEKKESHMDSDAIRKKLGKLFKLPGKK